MEYRTNLNQKNSKPAGALFILVGLCAIVASFFLSGGTQNFLKNAISTDGTVLELVESINHNSHGSSYIYAPKISFTTKNGEEYTVVSNSGSNPPAYRVGQKVGVLYNPKNPTDFRINSFLDIWGGLLILSGIGAVFFVIGLWMVFFV